MDIIKIMIEKGMFTQEEVDAADKRDADLQQAQEDHYNQWKPWLDANLDMVNGYLAAQRMFDKLGSASEDNVITVKPTKANLNSLIQFSKSRYNEYKKSEYVQYCLDALNNASPAKPLVYVPETTTGCFSAGAHGHGGKKGSSRFNAKFTTAGTYEMVVPFGMPFLILDHNKIVLFEGFYYNMIEVDQTLLDKYQEYRSGKPESNLPF